MDIFTHLKNLLVNKKDGLDLESYLPFMINRWLSFLGKPFALVINDTVNQLGMVDKDIHQRLLLTILPKMSYMQRIRYIKKSKKDKTPEEDIKIGMQASYLEISTRELKQMQDLQEAIANQ